MNVVNDTTILGQVKNAIANAEANNTAIKYIELSEEEMRNFLASPEFKIHPATDKHYAENQIPQPTKISSVKAEGDVPSSCVYMGILLKKVI